MSRFCPSFLSACGLFLALVTFLLQLVALTTIWWAKYTARTELGKPKENGHYGLWTLCSVKGPHWDEDCDPMDTFFQIPVYSHVAGILGIIHLLMLLTLLPLGSLRAIQIARNVPNLGLQPKTLCIAKVSVAFISVIFAILVAIFASVGENRQAEYSLQKEWSFWIQIAVIGADIVITLVCVIENFRFWQEHIKQQIDPDGERAETYGNPIFDSGSPEPTRHSVNCTIAYTESSGDPYYVNTLDKDKNSKTKSQKPSSKNQTRQQSPQRDSAKLHKKTKKSPSETLTYENEAYRERSPSTRRARRQEHYYYQ